MTEILEEFFPEDGQVNVGLGVDSEQAHVLTKGRPSLNDKLYNGAAGLIGVSWFTSRLDWQSSIVRVADVMLVTIQ